jgi:integrase
MAVVDPKGQVIPVGMLIQVRRTHLVKWRDSLVDRGEYRPKSINQRIQLVSAILRAGWREAEMPPVDLSKLTVPEPDDSGRRSWTRDEIKTAFGALEPASWSAWTYILGLSSSTRLGEFVAAKVGWWNPKTGFIEVPAAATKKKKPHAIPVLGCLRGAFERYLAKRPQDGFMFDAPRPTDSDVDLSKVASQWFQRFSRRFNPKLPTFHELRDTWIEEARHCPTVKREIWEIISGHSVATVSDRYGGEKPPVLLRANEDVCEFLTSDPELRAAILQLVS